MNNALLMRVLHRLADGNEQFQPLSWREVVIVAARGPTASVSRAMAENAKRAIIQCQSYAFLPKNQYESWKTIQLTFGLKDT